MRTSWQYLFTLACCLFSFAWAAKLKGPLVVRAGGVHDIKITAENTINATTTKPAGPQIWQLDKGTAGQLNLSVTNNLPSNNVNVYVTGLDANGALVMLAPTGSWYYLPDTNASIPQPVRANVATPLGPQGSVTNITLPGYIQAGRIWFADGELQFFTVNGGNGPALVEPSAVNPSDPSAEVNWGFVELTWGAGIGIYANISYVDFVGLPLGMKLINAAGYVQSAYGVAAGAVANMCNELIEQAQADGQPWDQMCMVDAKGNPLRVLSPTQYLAINGAGFQNYWSNYIDQVWEYYTTNNLTINTQAGSGYVNCSVPGHNQTLLLCEGDNRGYAKPTPSDLFGCNGGPFAIWGGDNGVHYAVVPRLCAAFHRTTALMVPGGNLQPGLSSEYFYMSNPTNHYSRIVHEYEVDGKGYAFAYDDVTPDGAINESGLLADPNPVLLALTVGGPTCSGPGCTSHAVNPVPLSSSVLPSSSATTLRTSSKSTSTVSSSTTTSLTTSTKSTSSSTAITTSTTSQTKKSSSTTAKTTKSSAAKPPKIPVIKTKAKTSTSAAKPPKIPVIKTKKPAASTAASTSAKSSTSTKSGAATTSTTTKPSSPTKLTCPASNGTLYTSNKTAVYQVRCYEDHFSGDMGFGPTPDLEGCIALCVSTPGCIDVSYEITQSVCYLKNVLYAVQQSETVWGAVFVSSVTGSPTSTATATPVPGNGKRESTVPNQVKKVVTTIVKTKRVDGTLTTVTRTKTIKVKKSRRSVDVHDHMRVHE